eukprot:COSAG02_NODE_4541_length_5234_cov_4.080818_6_plen_73_part_00
MGCRYTLHLDEQLVLNGTGSGNSYSMPVSITQGKKMKLKFEYSQVAQLYSASTDIGAQPGANSYARPGMMSP